MRLYRLEASILGSAHIWRPKIPGDGIQLLFPALQTLFAFNQQYRKSHTY